MALRVTGLKHPQTRFHGTVCDVTHMAPPPPLMAHWRKHGLECRHTVTNGTSIDRDALWVIFQPYLRVDTASGSQRQQRTVRTSRVQVQTGDRMVSAWRQRTAVSVHTDGQNWTDVSTVSGDSVWVYTEWKQDVCPLSSLDAGHSGWTPFIQSVSETEKVSP